MVETDVVIFGDSVGTVLGLWSQDMKSCYRAQEFRTICFVELLRVVQHHV